MLVFDSVKIVCSFRNNLVIICEIIYTICKLSRLEVHCMEFAVKILYTPEEQTRQEIRNFVNEGLKDVQENALYLLPQRHNH